PVDPPDECPPLPADATLTKIGTAPTNAIRTMRFVKSNASIERTLPLKDKTAGLRIQTVKSRLMLQPQGMKVRSDW
ncbi:MAG TPA: hypothetical protein VE242_02205, partial [Chthoniobacterales bacterium]|nr:hypothetical protein [Chthoniobacterales bacterium]